MPGLFGAEQLMELPDSERRFWAREARRARARGVLDFSRGASTPWLDEGARERLFEDLCNDLHLYAGEQAERKAAQEAHWAAERRRLKEEL